MGVEISDFDLVYGITTLACNTQPFVTLVCSWLCLPPALMLLSYVPSRGRSWFLKQFRVKSPSQNV